MERVARVLRQMLETKSPSWLGFFNDPSNKARIKFDSSARFVKNHTRVFLSLFIVFAVGISLIVVPRSLATVALFYPSTCEGGWKNPNNAVGQPSLSGEPTLSQYSDVNSAVLDGTRAAIRCGNFFGTIPGGSNPKTFTIKLHWSIDDGSVVHDGQVHDEPVIDKEAETPSYDEPVTEPATEDQPVDESPDASIDETPVVDEMPAPETDVPASEETPAPETEAPVSNETPAPQTDAPQEEAPVLPAFIRATTEETAPAPAEAAPAEVPAAEAAPAAPVESAPAPSTESAPSSDGAQASLTRFFASLSTKVGAFTALVIDGFNGGTKTPPSDAVLEIRYTIDGVTWVNLGTVSATDWKDKKFTIISPGVGAWGDLSNFQVGVFSLAPEGKQPAVYLDSISMEVGYATETETSTPTVKVDDESIGILTPHKEDFSLDESPSFSLVDPELTTDAIIGLVRENKATIIQDKYGVLVDTGQALKPSLEKDVLTAEKGPTDIPVVTPEEEASPVEETPAPAVETPPSEEEQPAEEQVLPAFIPKDTAPVEEKTQSAPEADAKEEAPVLPAFIRATIEEAAPAPAAPVEPAPAPSTEPAPATPAEAATPDAPTQDAPSSSVSDVAASALGAYAGGANGYRLPAIVEGGVISPASTINVRPVAKEPSALARTFSKFKNKLRSSLARTLTHGLLALAGDAGEAETVDAVVLDSLGRETTIPVSVERLTVDGERLTQVKVSKPDNMFVPGKYTLRVTLHAAEANIVSERDFSWGVLALNVDRSIYMPDATAYVQMGVIDDLGHTVCDASMTLVVTDPSGADTTYTTDSGAITREPLCGPDNRISVPDYYMNLPLGPDTGTYELTLTATTDNGPRTVHDSFEVRDSVAFDVQRTGPTRIYPVDPYPVTMKITSESDWKGTVVEKMPDVFTPSVNSSVAAYDSTETLGGVTMLYWNLDLKAGVPVTIGYDFLAPPISPEFYLLGPLSFFDDGADTHVDTPVFSELRRWQIADDAVCTAAATGSWGTAGTWSCGHVPLNSDSVVINSGAVVTLSAATATSIQGIQIDGTLDTSGSNYTIDTTTLSIGATGTLIANGSTINITGASTSGTLFSITSGGVFTSGTSTVNFTGAATTGAQMVGGTGVFTGANKFYLLGINNVSFAAPLGADIEVGGGNGIANWGITITTGTFNLNSNGAACTGTNYNFTTTGMIMSGGTINACGSTMTMTLNTGSGFAWRRTGGTFNYGTSLAIFTMSTTFQSLNFTAETFYNLRTAVTSGSGIIRLGNSLTIASGGKLHIQQGAFANNNQTVSAAATNVILQMDANTEYVETSNFTMTNFTNANMLLDPTSTIRFLGPSAASLTPPYQNIIMESTTGFSQFATGAVNVAGDFTFLGKGGSGFYPEGNVTVGGTYSLTSVSGGFCINYFNGSITSYNLTAAKIVIGTGCTLRGPGLAGKVFTLTGTTGTLFTNNGTFTAGWEPGFAFTGNGSPTLFGGTAVATVRGDFTMTPTLTSGVGNIVYTMGVAPSAYTGNFTMNPSGSANTLTFTLGAALTLPTATSKVLTVTGTGSARGIFDTNSTSNYGVTADNLVIGALGTFNANASTITLPGTTGTLMSLTSGGVFNAGTSTVTMTQTAGTVTVNTSGFTGANSLYNLTMVGNSLGVNDTLGAAMTVTNITTVTSGSLNTSASNYAFSTGYLTIANSSSAQFKGNASTVTLTGTTGTLMTVGASATMTLLTSTNFAVTSLGSVTVFSGQAISFAGLSATPTLAGSGYTYTLGVAPTLSGTFMINPSGTANTLTVALSATTNFGSASIIAVSGSGSASGVFDTSTSNYALTAGAFSVGTGGTFNARASAISLAGTTGPLMTQSGSGFFIAGTSTISITQTTTTVTLNTAGFTGSNALYNLTIVGVNLGATSTMAGDLTVTNATTITTATLNTSVSNYTLTTGTLTVANAAAARLTPNSSTIVLTGSTGTLVTIGAAATFTGSNASFTFAGDGSVTLFAGQSLSIVNLTFSPTLTGNRVYTMGVMPTAISGDFTMNPSGSANSLTYTQLAAFPTIAAAQTLTIKATGGNASAIMNTGGFTQSTGHMVIDTGGTLNASSSAITVTGTTGTLWTQNGTMTGATSGVTFNGAANSSQLFTAGSAVSFPNNVTVNNTSFAAPLGANTSIGGTLTITLGTVDVSNSGNYALTTGFISIANSASAILNLRAGTLNMNGTGAGTLLSKGASGVFTQGTSTVVVKSPSGTPSIANAALTFYKLWIDTGALVAPSGTTTQLPATYILLGSSSLTVSATTGTRDFYIVSGTLSLGADTVTASTVNLLGTATGQFAMAAGSKLMVNGCAVSGLAGSACNTGSSNFPAYTGNWPSASNFALDAASTVVYFHSGSAASDIQTVNNTPVYGNVEITPIKATSKPNSMYQFVGTTTIVGNLTFTIIENTGHTTNYNGMFLGNNSNPTYLLVGGNFTQSLQVGTDPCTSNACKQYIDTNYSGSTPTYFSVGGNFINGNASPTAGMESGVMQPGATSSSGTVANIAVGGNWVNNGAGIWGGVSGFNNTLNLTVGGNFTQDGTFTSTVTATPGTVTFNKAATSIIAGTATKTFYNLSAIQNFVGLPTVSAATPAVVTMPGHGLSIGDPVYFTATAMPTGMSANTTYYVIATGFTSTQFQVSTTPGGGAVGAGTVGNAVMLYRDTYVGKELDFTAGQTFTATNGFTVFGRGGALVKLFSTTPASTWTLVPPNTGGSTVDYADVMDSNCSSAGSTKFINATHSTDDGNNSLQTAGCWSFGQPYINMSLSTNVVELGTLTIGAARYGTPGTGTGGSPSDPSNAASQQITVATSGSGGYNLYVQGASLNNGSHTIQPLNSGSAPSIPGTEQFGIRLDASGGLGTVMGPYSSPTDFAFNATPSAASMIAQLTTASLLTTTYYVHYLANINAGTATGSYSTNLTYVTVANF